MWELIPVGLTALGAIHGANRAAEERKFNRAQAEVTRYSPWTGMSGQIRPVQYSAFGGGLQGFGTGMALYQSAKRAFGDTDKPESVGTGTMGSRAAMSGNALSGGSSWDMMGSNPYSSSVDSGFQMPSLYSRAGRSGYAL